MSSVDEKQRPTVTDDHSVQEEVIDERVNLRHVPGKIPWFLFIICVVEFGERFVYLGITGPLQNYIQHPYVPGSEIPGALGRGQSVGVALGNFFKFWSYFCVFGGAIVADQYLGKYRTILASSPIYISGLIILVCTATPAAIQANASFGGLIAAMILIGIGTGGLKACIAPLCGEQSTGEEKRIETLKSGEVVVVDPALTTARVFMWYYWAANVGGLSTLMTVAIEKEASFWLAYLLPLLVFLVVLAVFIAFSKKINRTGPSGSPVLDAFKTVTIAMKEGSLEKAKPSALQASGHLQRHKLARELRYTDLYVDQIKSGFGACKLFLLFPFYFLCWSQIFTNLISQAGSMELGSTPNDMMQNLQTIFMLAFIPILDILIYPLLRKFNISFPPLRRIFAGFMCSAISMTYACVLQYYIYNRPSKSIYVWIQTPAYIFGALSEIFVIVTGLEVAFLKAPANLRVLVSSVFWMAIAVGAAMGIALSPVSRDPFMVWTYAGLAGGVFGAGCLLLGCFWDGIVREAPELVRSEHTRMDDFVVNVVSKDDMQPSVMKAA